MASRSVNFCLRAIQVYVLDCWTMPKDSIILCSCWGIVTTSCVTSDQRAMLYRYPIFQSNQLCPYLRSEKNQLLLPFGLPALPFASCACSPLSTGMLGPPPFTSAPPPPRKGLAIREPAPPKLKPEAIVELPARPRVEPSLAASRRSLTAANWPSNL